MVSRCALRLLAACGATALAAPGAAAQDLDVAPTFQASVATAFTEAPRSRFQAFGVMLGMPGSGRWSPHVWAQRYRIESDCQAGIPAAPDCRVEGWTVSVGPALRFLDTPSWTGDLVTQVGLEARARSEVTGGAGVHLGVKLGVFRPYAFSRLDVFRGVGYTTVGVGLRFRISTGPGAGDPEWGDPAWGR